MTKKIRLDIESVNSKEIIKIFCNETFKFKVSEDNSINGKEIYDSLEYEIGNSYELEPIPEKIKETFPKLFKSFSELYNLYNEILEEVNNIEIN